MKVSRLSRVGAFVGLVIAVLLVAVAPAVGSRGHVHATCDSLCKEKQRLERNKSNVVNFYTLAFNDKNPREAVRRYGGAMYIQHNPLAANGFDAFISFVEFFTTQFPDIHIDIRRVIAEGDLVVTHSLATGQPFGPRGSKVVDIFRCDAHGKIVEHWDVLAQISETSANGNPEV